MQKWRITFHPGFKRPLLVPTLNLLVLLRHKSLQFFAIIGLLLGQWFAVVHAIQHNELESPGKPPCAICAVAHASGITPSSVQIPAMAAPAAQRICEILPAAPAVRRAAPPQSRAPPAIPA